MNVISLFSGCGGLDLGFKNAGFNIIWANENSKLIKETYEKNHPETLLDQRSIVDVPSKDIPNNIIGIVGGPPCQSWSVAGQMRGESDPRGKLFFEFIRIIRDKQPLFFVVENVAGMMASTHKESFEKIKSHLEGAGYQITPKVINAADFEVPQNRYRLFIVGYRNDLNSKFVFPEAKASKVTVRQRIYDLKDSALKAIGKNDSNKDKCIVANHEYYIGGYSYIFMSRNRVLPWDGQAFTIQAAARQVSIHPQAPPMIKVETDVMKFAPGYEALYRRLTVRECARLQTFPDEFIFHYDKLNVGYRMIGNAVPVRLAEILANKIYNDIFD